MEINYRLSTNCKICNLYWSALNLYHKTYQIQNVEVYRLVLQLSLPNPLKPGVKSGMKM